MSFGNCILTDELHGTVILPTMVKSASASLLKVKPRLLGPFPPCSVPCGCFLGTHRSKTPPMDISKCTPQFISSMLACSISPALRNQTVSQTPSGKGQLGSGNSVINTRVLQAKNTFPAHCGAALSAYERSVDSAWLLQLFSPNSAVC